MEDWLHSLRYTNMTESMRFAALDLVKELNALRKENKGLRESVSKLEGAFEYADREARLAIEYIKVLENHTNSCPYRLL